MRSRMEIKQAPFQSQVSQLQLVDSPSYLPAPCSAAGSGRSGGDQGYPGTSEPIGPLEVRFRGKPYRRRWEPMLFLLPVILTEPLSPSQPHISPSSIIATGGTRLQKGEKRSLSHSTCMYNKCLHSPGLCPRTQDSQG